MNRLETSFMGMKLKNPIIVSSSGLTNSTTKIKALAEQGAGAVILKSIFEEQINHETSSLLRANDYAEAAAYIRTYAKGQSVSAYLKLIEETKKETNIPIVGSINCVSDVDWTGFASSLESAGADGLELNIHIIPTDRRVSSVEHEQKYIEIVHKVAEKVKIPVAVKIGQHFSNLVQFVDMLASAGANAVTLFNRFYHPDIDIDKMEITSSPVFSTPDDIKFSLRWIAILSGKLRNIGMSASTGIHDAEGVIKQLLAGAQTTQICSTVYKNGPEVISKILADLNAWMDDKGFDSISEFRGKLSSTKIKDPAVYERAQFMKYFAEME